MEFELATLTPEQHEAINALERRLGLVLVAYRPYRPEGPDGRREAPAGPGVQAGYRFEVAAEPGPDPEVLAALNETYRSMATGEQPPTGAGGRATAAQPLPEAAGGPGGAGNPAPAWPAAPDLDPIARRRRHFRQRGH